VSDISGAAPGQFVDPYRSYNFKLVVPGLAEAHFTDCTGLGVRVTPITYREGGTTQVHRIPGPVDYAEVTLRYGLTQSRQLWDWFMTAVKGTVLRQNVSILLLDPDGTTERLRWDLIRAWPSEWRGAPLDASSYEIAIETLTLVFESLERS
jgi:phage tail-like protein